MKPNGLVVDEEVFSALSAECEKIIDTRKRLPDFVFRRPFARYFAIKYAHIYKKEFGAFLFTLSNIFGDESSALIFWFGLFRTLKLGGEVCACAVA
jgi:hypothetical protein